METNISSTAAPSVEVPRMVSLGHVARCAMMINAMGCLMAAIGTVGFETLCAALYWPWVTFIAVAMTSKPRANK